MRRPMRWPATWPPPTARSGPRRPGVLELIRYHLDIGRLPAAAIERGARARYMAL